jgi:hypothetical protein
MKNDRIKKCYPFCLILFVKCLPIRSHFFAVSTPWSEKFHKSLLSGNRAGEVAFVQRRYSRRSKGQDCKQSQEKKAHLFFHKSPAGVGTPYITLWFIKNISVCRYQDLPSFLYYLTLPMLCWDLTYRCRCAIPIFIPQSIGHVLQMRVMILL